MSCLNYWSTKEAVKLDQLIKISFKYLTLEQRHLALPWNPEIQNMESFKKFKLD